VTPGFDFADFHMPKRTDLLKLLSNDASDTKGKQYNELIIKLSKDE
jgi:predicted cupin superfamily sugar epimerase